MRAPFSIVSGCAANTPPSHVAALLEAGVAELYVGYVPQRWLQQFGAEVSPNRRYFIDRQFTEPAQILAVAQQVHAAGAALTLTLNEHHLTERTAGLVLSIAEEAVELGVDGFIVADLALLSALRQRFPDRARILSNEAATYNAAAAALAVEHGATRIVFPREMMLTEMAAIAAHLRTLETPPELEAFIAREYCQNSSSLCYAAHGYRRRTHFCFSHQVRTLVDLHSGAEVELSNSPPGWSSEPSFLSAISDLHRCGFCAIEPLREMGVRFLKVPGRSDSALPAVRRLARLLEQPDQFPETSRRMVGSDAFCSSGHYCYYALSPASQDAAQERVGTISLSAPESPLEKAPSPVPELSVYLSLGDSTPADLDALAHGGLSEYAARLVGPVWQGRVARDCIARAAALGFEVDRAPARVHLGLELCGLRLPRPAAAAHQVALARAAGFEVSLVLPVAFQTFWEPLMALLAAVSAQSLELVVNDLGLLRALSGSGLKLATGRIFNRMKRHQLAQDPDADRPDPAGIEGLELSDASGLLGLRKRQHEVYGAGYLGSEFYTELLRGFGVRRVGTDVLSTPLSSAWSADFEVDLYAPWSYLTSTRACPLVTHFEGGSTSTPTRSCEKPCQRCVVTSQFPWSGGQVAQRGVGTFVDASKDWPAFQESLGVAVGRLIVELKVPV